MSDLKSLNGMPVNGFTTLPQLLDGVSNAFRAQADFLQRMQSLTTEFLQRPRTEYVAAQHLVEHLGAARDPSDVLKAQHEWLAGATQRMMADAVCLQSVGMEVLNDMSRWYPQDVPAAVNQEHSPRRAAKVAAQVA